MKLFTCLLIFLVCGSLPAQIGGTYTYEWLGSPASARLTALGGSLITVADDDLALGATNPALLNIKTDHQISLNHNFSFAGVGNGYIGYGHSIDSTFNIHIGAAYAQYGDFVLADELGNNQGTFSGSEGALILGASKRLNERITVGANVKTVFGSLESYSSFGLVTDLGLTYKNPASLWELAFLVKNIGLQVSAYGNERAAVPLDVQIGFSRKLKHLPFRISVLLHNMHRYGIRYDDPTRVGETDLFGNPINESSSLSKEFDNFFRHIVIGGEFLLGKNQNLRLRFAYNHLRRQELSVSSFRSLAGFSAGFGIKIKGLRIDYGLGYHHIAGAANHLTISTNLGRFFKHS